MWLEWRSVVSACAFSFAVTGAVCVADCDEPAVSNSRSVDNESNLRSWLTNMVGYHRFTPEEVRFATGMSSPEIDAAIKRFVIAPGRVPARTPGDPLVVLPYPGGRHPRIGFLEGAIDPQRETKISVFTPWADGGYVVADIPEAIWSNLGLTYLAHSHVPTIWSKQNIELEKLEWTRLSGGELQCERTLPNGIRFGTKVRSTSEAVRMEMWLFNGTPATLSDLRVQNCVMLKGANGFAEQTNDNKVFDAPYTACRNAAGNRWVISAWEPCQRAWGNKPCPCLHSDPQFPDCPPGETRHVRGWLSFYEGADIRGEFRRIDSLGWRKAD